MSWDSALSTAFEQASPPLSPAYVLEPVYPEYLASPDDDIPVKYQPLPADALPTALSPIYIADSNPKEDPEEDPADYRIDGGDDDDDDEEEQEASEDDDEEE
nr:hypothetical protein [Tanacetum cinerariifolium]